MIKLNKKNPVRRCSACYEMKEKEFLFRVVQKKIIELKKIIDYKYFIDFIGKEEGRGAYICKNNICINKSLKTKSFNRSFKKSIPQEIYQELNNLIKEHNG